MADGPLMEATGDGTITRAVFDQHVRRYGRLLFHLAHEILHDVEAAEDACQQALCKAWENRKRIQHANVLRQWMATVATREALQVLRRRGTERRATEMISRHHRHAPRPDDEIALRESVLQALDRLSPQTRLVVIMRLMRGMSGNEVASFCGCSASEVSRRLHEGMDLLRDLLKEAP